MAGWGLAAGLGVGAFAYARRVVKQRRERLALRLANQNLCVLVRSEDGLGRDLAARLVHSGMAVHWVDGGKLSTPDGVRVVRAAVDGLEYDLAIVSCSWARLGQTLSELATLEDTPTLVISRSVGDRSVVMTASGRSSLLVGVPGATDTGAGAHRYGFTLGELDGARSQRLRLAQRILERAGLEARRSRGVDVVLRRQSLLALVEALCQLEARRDEAQVGTVRALARAQNAARPDAERLIRRAGWPYPDWAQLAARRWQAWAPMGPDEVRQLMTELEDMAETSRTPIPVLADLGNAL